jgi:adenylate cyclase
MFYSICAWELAVGLYVMIRSYGAISADDQVTGGTAVSVSLIGGFLLGLISWLSDIISDTKSFRAKSYGLLIVFKGISLLVGVALVILLARHAALSVGIIEEGQVLASFIDRLTDKSMLPVLLYVGATAVTFSFIRQTVKQVGGRVLLNLILGKYYHPKEEERIFMFLDLKSSTSIAEKLGHAQFSRLLQDCFRDLTDSAIKYGVEIYLYVGDEAVLTWEIGDGVKRSGCIRIFYDFQNTLVGKAQYYQEKFGLAPEFKAGLNAGQVTVAEIGVIKKHIAYHGDVLNTAARIEGKCNEYGKKILVSAHLKEILCGDESLVFELMGSVPLRGKKKAVDIYSADAVS